MKPMSEHESSQAMLALLAADALGPEEVIRVKRHADGCEMCRRELDAWGVYARGLSALPQPVIPAGLLERTRLRMTEHRELSAARREDNWMLAALVAFGWAASLTTWILIRTLTGGALSLLGVNLVNVVNWMLLSTVLVWMTAAIAAAMLGRRSDLERTTI